MKDYYEIDHLQYECNCTEISITKWEQLMKDAVKANKGKVNRLVKKYLPWLYSKLQLDFHNPYNYYRTKTHLVLVHSNIEYFIKYK